MSQHDYQNRRVAVSFEAADKFRETKKRRANRMTENVNTHFDVVPGLGGGDRSSAGSFSIAARENVSSTGYVRAPFYVGDKVKILRGEYNGKMAMVKEAHPQCVIAEIENKDLTTRLFPLADVRLMTVKAIPVDTNMISAEDSEISKKAALQEEDNEKDSESSNEATIQDDNNEASMAISNEDFTDEVVRNDGDNTSFVEDDDKGGGINKEEALVIGMEVIKTKDCDTLCSSSQSRNDIDSRHQYDIENRQLQKYQPEQQLIPRYGIGTDVLIIEGKFREYCGIVVECEDGTAGEAQHQDKVCVKLYINSTLSSPIIITTETHFLMKIKNLPTIIQHHHQQHQQQQQIVTLPTRLIHQQSTTNGEQSWSDNHNSCHQQNRIDEEGRHQQQQIVTPPTRSIHHEQSTTNDEQSWSDNYNSCHQQNRIDEEGQHLWNHPHVQDDDSMSNLNDATSKSADVIEYGKTMIQSDDDDISAKNSDMKSPLPTSSSSDRQQDDDSNDIVYYKGNQAAVQEREGDRIKIFLLDGTIEDIHKNELDRNFSSILKKNSDMVSQHDDDTDKLHRVSKNDVHDDNGDDDNNDGDNVHTTNDEWRIPGSTDGGLRFSGQLVRSFRLGAYKEENFIDSFLRTRKLVVIKDFNKEQMKLPVVPIETMTDGSVYELISTKVMDETGGASLFKMCAAKVLHMAYVQTAGPGLEKVSIQDLLSRIADFGSLTPRKMVARLELFQSPAWTMDSTLQPSDFQEIPEEGQVGCGFICERLLKNLLLRHIKTKKSVSNTVADITICIQVRIFIPSLGVYKGVLMKKYIPPGSPQIQLPSSMRKIGPSRAKNPLKGAFLVINKAGLDPSENNKSIGRLPHIDPHSPASCAKSFTPVVMSDMLIRMFIGLGVSKEITYKYFRESKRKDGLEHCFVRGVIDPTGKLPPGTVFLSGTKDCQEVRDMLYVTRSPCLKFDDARMIPVITSKPSTLSLSEWNWLNRLPFGVLIFSLPKKGMKSIPEHIANGDLDGDRYFVCWSKAILENIKADPITDMLSTDIDVINSTLTTATPGCNTEKHHQNNPNWLKQAQDHMCATFIDTQKIGQLIGTLYKMAQDTADKHSLRHADVTHYAIAFAQALDNGKHGGRIELPMHLYRQVRGNLQELLTIK